MLESDTVILNKKEIAHKIKRIAYQVYEANVAEKEIIIAGIKENGFIFAKKSKPKVEKSPPLKSCCARYTSIRKILRRQ